MDILFSWLLQNWFEVTAAGLGLFSIYFQIKQKPLYWPVSIVMVTMYIFVYYNARFYADMSLQFYYLFVGFYGWYYWVFGNKSKNNSGKITPPVTSLNFKQIILAVCVAIVLFFVILHILIKYTNSDVPVGDAFTTALSFAATWLLAKKILENWIFWIVVDVISTGLYLYKELYATAVLFFVLTILAIVGYIKWKKSMINYE